MSKNIIDLSVRFVLGGSAVALCYILLIIIPWKSLAGIFAAFPAVMISAVIIAGSEKGRTEASEVAYGAIAGMCGGLICVLATWLSIKNMNLLAPSIVAGIICWLIGSTAFFVLMKKAKKKPNPLQVKTHA
ncbi:DUF3147 family protein [Desulforamulus aquiferis]|uniref:DUF3147 family protein n=1 Tax=Desulforamulus aquiferis TaxID=1397668 RepID=A0AAW7ZDJ1_9FIRM|nr:DUF3147 family protein [Desulforamulus aquiferis]MDO7787402.1 DUF3147 family protein [Desulforamulus aquiferis]